MWLRSWFRDERFWRDVVSQAIAGLLTAIAVAILTTIWFALVGIVPSIGWKAVLLAVGLGLLPVTLGLTYVPRTWTQREGETPQELVRRVKRSELPRGILTVAALALLIAGVLIP